MSKLKLSEIPHRTGRGGIIIDVKVEPRASRTEVLGIHGNALKVKLTAPPVEGRANKQLIEVLSEYFGLKKRQLEVIGGSASRRKTVLITGVEED
jgi:hypothetical protein